MNYTHARFGIYIFAALGGIATVVAMAGYGTYEHDTGMFDLHPIDVRAVAAYLASIVANGLAAIAAWRRWGRTE
jgi:hypothetical protein